MCALISWILAKVAGFTSSSFFSSLLTALGGGAAGAYFGAYAAQKISDRNSLRDKAESELRNLNLSIFITTQILDSTISHKKQLVGPIVEIFNMQLAKLQAGRWKENDQVPQGINLQSIPTLDLPVHKLREVVWNINSLHPKIYSSMEATIENLNNFNDILARREKLISQYIEFDNKTRMEHCFGIKVNGVQVNYYPDCMSHMLTYTEHVIFYSFYLYKHLIDEFKQKNKEYKDEYKQTPFVLTYMNFEELKQHVPSDDNYKDWLRSWQVIDKNK